MSIWQTLKISETQINDNPKEVLELSPFEATVVNNAVFSCQKALATESQKPEIHTKDQYVDASIWVNSTISTCKLVNSARMQTFVTVIEVGM